MILLAGQNPVANVLHIVVGPESDFWMQLHGAAVVNLSPVLEQLNRDLPIYLHLTRCGSEQETAKQIGAAAASGSAYPFAPPAYIFLPNSGIGYQSAPDFTPARPAGQPDSTGRCSRCHADRVKLIPELSPSICYSCARIDLGLAEARRAARSKPQEKGDGDARSADKPG